MPPSPFISFLHRFHVSAFFLWLIAITFASLLPESTLPDRPPLPLGTDKAAHILMYTILVWLARPAFLRESKDHPYRRLLVIAPGIIIYGALLDILQPVLSSRSLEWADILANSTGVLCGSLLCRVVPERNQTKQTNR